ncbi:MAG: hypothetical protein WCH99_15495 [Verrucomicrobiota bacterium]
MEAAERRQQRSAQKRQRELERQAKEMAKMSQAEQARLEVETFENSLDVLLSVHKEQGETWDWVALASALPPPLPQKLSFYELRARQMALVANLGQTSATEEAQRRDELVFQKAMQDYEAEKAEHEQLKSLAHRILAQEYKAFIEALVGFSPLGELSDLGSLLHFTVHNAKLIQCDMKVSGMQVIPSEVKTLTSSGKVSVKPMPKNRFHEIYHDYVCGCILRVAREVFAMLPVETLLVTASADFLNSRTGHTVEQPVLSAVMPRSAVTQLRFEHLDPSDALENFQCRGDFKASRKDGAFKPITPLTPSDFTHSLIQDMGFSDLIKNIQKVREEIKLKIDELSLIAGSANLLTD